MNNVNRSEFIYGMKSRGYSIGCQPMDGLIRTQPDANRNFYDILVYNRELTDDEVRHYSLTRLYESAKQIQIPRLAIIVKDIKTNSIIQKKIEIVEIEYAITTNILTVRTINSDVLHFDLNEVDIQIRSV